MKQTVKLLKLMHTLPEDVQDSIRAVVPDIENAVVQRISITSDDFTLEEGERAAIRYISTRVVDDHRTIFDPDGIITDQYMLNPIVLWTHDRSIPPIGKTEWIKVDDVGVLAKTVYAETELANEIWTLVKGGFLNCVSIGATAIELTNNGDRNWQPTVQRLSQKWGVDPSYFSKVRTIFTKWMLTEYSDCAVGSNPLALTVEVARSLGISDNTIQQLGIPEEITVPEAEQITKLPTLPETEIIKRLPSLPAMSRIDLYPTEAELRKIILREIQKVKGIV